MPIDVNGESHYSTEELMQVLAVETRRVRGLLANPPWHESRDEAISESRVKRQNKTLKQRVLSLEAELRAVGNPDDPTRRYLDARIKDLTARLAKANQIIQNSQRRIQQARKAVFDVERALDGHAEKAEVEVPKITSTSEPPVTF